MLGLEYTANTRSPTIGQVRGRDSSSKSPSPSKQRREKLRNNEGNITWGKPEIRLCLFKAVLAKEPYLKSGSIDKNKAWLEAKDMFFQQDCMADYSETKDSVNSLRNFKVVYFFIPFHYS